MPKGYVPAGQKPVALRCPPGQHAHGGMGYCHPQDRQHRVAHAELHQEQARLRAIEHRMNQVADQMHSLAQQRRPVPGKLRDDFRRLYTYLQRVKGTRRQLPINRAMGTLQAAFRKRQSKKLLPEQSLYTVRQGDTQAMLGKNVEKTSFQR